MAWPVVRIWLRLGSWREAPHCCHEWQSTSDQCMSVCGCRSVAVDDLKALQASFPIPSSPQNTAADTIFVLAKTNGTDGGEVDKTSDQSVIDIA